MGKVFKSIVTGTLAFSLMLGGGSLWAEEPELAKIGTFKCGKQPKQVLFSPDGKFVLMPLLDDNGFDVFSLAEKKITQRISPPESSKAGFAEGLFIPEKNVFLVSQMTTGTVYEYTWPNLEFKRSIKTKGEWSKFIAYSSEKNLLAVSNWITNDVSLIDYETGNLVRKLKTGHAPRGLWFIKGGSEILSLSFDDGIIEKFSVDSSKLISSIKVDNAAMRHIVCDKEEKFAYISDMYHKEILKVDIGEMKIAKRISVFNNPNTIDLHKNRWLFVSCRGPNNPKDYTLPSLVNGKVYVIDTDSMKIVKVIDGGNQPTGLDVSDDGTLLCFSNFQDANIEIYEINEISDN